MLHDDKEHTGVGAITSPPPAVFIPASRSQSFLCKLCCGQTDIFFFVLFFLIPFCMESNISLVPLGHFEPIFFFFFQEMWRFINSILGLSFYQSVPLLPTPNERDSFSHSGKNKNGALEPDKS